MRRREDGIKQQSQTERDTDLLLESGWTRSKLPGYWKLPGCEQCWSFEYAVKHQKELDREAALAEAAAGKQASNNEVKSL